MKKPLKFLQTFIRPFKSPLGKDSQQQKEEDLETIAAQEQKQFSFESLVAATQDFHSKQRLGQGGFGPVFKGKLEDGKEIAVKKLSRSSNQGKKEFTTEAKLLARVQHKNVVNLLGYCAHGAEKLLVYEYVANESLDKLLFKSSDGGKRGVLDWKKRYDVIIGVARGLLYLHEDSHICIVHRDIKASNILLDDKWNPKIADFGMARLFPEDQTHVNTRVAGTNGYMAPEYVMHGLLSVKADVFSYGVLVLELISGRKNSTFTGEAEAQNLLEWVGWQIIVTVGTMKFLTVDVQSPPFPIVWSVDNRYSGHYVAQRYLDQSHYVAHQAWKLYKKGRGIEIMDPTLSSTMSTTEQVSFCIQVGLLCTQADPKLRPTMRKVVVMLSKKPATLDEPTRPGYPGSRYTRPRRNVDNSNSSDSMSREANASSLASASTSITHTATTSMLTSPTPQSRGKQPMEG